MLFGSATHTEKFEQSPEARVTKQPADETTAPTRQNAETLTDRISRLLCLAPHAEGHATASQKQLLSDEALMQLEGRHSAPIANPFKVVFVRGKGPHLFDSSGKKYLDLVTGYSVANQGHANARIIKAMTAQAKLLSLTSRMVYNDKLPLLLQKISQVSGFEQVIPMNSGAEAVETALKIARRYGYQKKGIPDGQAEVIVFDGNFHGRTVSAVSMSSDSAYQRGFGPLLPGFKNVPFGDAAALEKAITKNTAAVLVEPIQGEGGIIVPPEGYLQNVRALTQQHQVLFIADEIQTGLGRTGKLFAHQHTADVKPDMLILGKALSGGMYPISAVAASKEIMSVLEPGSHGSTFGGNPLAAAVGLAALKEFDNGKLIANSQARGEQIFTSLRKINSPLIAQIRGKGLFIGVQLTINARPVAEALLAKEQMYTKDTHGTTLRIAPVLGITEGQARTIAPAFERVLKSFE